MASKQLSNGLFHKLPADLKSGLIENAAAYTAWEDISDIARNEWICWTISVKQEKTRTQHIERACADLARGKRRPCCWVGCLHRTDKPVSPWAQKFIINDAS